MDLKASPRSCLHEHPWSFKEINIYSAIWLKWGNCYQPQQTKLYAKTSTVKMPKVKALARHEQILQNRGDSEVQIHPNFASGGRGGASCRDSCSLWPRSHRAGPQNPAISTVPRGPGDQSPKACSATFQLQGLGWVT